MWLEFVAAVLLGGGYLYWQERLCGHVLVTKYAEHRQGFYSAFTSVAVTMLGFTLSALAILLGLAFSNTLRQVRKSERYEELWAVFLSAVNVLGLATLWGLAAIQLDDKWTLGRMMFAGVLFFLVLGTLRTWRAIWVTGAVVELIVARSRVSDDDDDPEDSDASGPSI